MQHPTQVFFDLLANDVESHARQIAQRVRRTLPAALVADMTAEEHRQLEVELREEMRTVVWRFLSHFDNVGCHLPPGVLGYTILSTAESNADQTPQDIRVAHQDYADTWLEVSNAAA